MNSPENKNHSPEKPGRGRKAAGKLALATALMLSGAAATNAIGNSLDTSHHSVEVKQGLEDTLKPIAEDLGKKLLDFAEAKKEDPKYTISVFKYDGGEQTKISTYLNNDTLKTYSTYTVDVDPKGNVAQVSGEKYFKLGDSDSPSKNDFIIVSPNGNSDGEWRAAYSIDGVRYHTGDQGLVGMYGDKRSDTERAADIAEIAGKMVDAFTE